MSEQRTDGEAKHDAEAQYLLDTGWHRDQNEQRRWRHPALTEADPMTQAAALQFQRQLDGNPNKQAAAGGPKRIH